MPLTKTRDLMAGVAAVLELPGLPPDETGGYRLTIGETTTVLIYPQNDESLLIVAPLGPLPAEIAYGTTLYLLRLNAINSELDPFRTAVDEGGGLILWGSVPVDAVTDKTLAGLIGALADRVDDIRQEVFEEAPEDDEDEGAPAEMAG